MNNTTYNPQFHHQPFVFQVKHAWLMVLLYMAITFFFALPVSFVGVFIDVLGWDDYRELAHDVGMVASNLLAYIGLFFLIFRLFKPYFRGKPLLENKPVSVESFSLLLLFTVAFAVVFEPVVSVIDFIPLPHSLKALLDSLKSLMEQALKPGLTTFFLAVIIAPIGEEVLLRGIVLRGLLRTYSPKKAILLSAFIFAVIHLNPWQGVSAFVAGVIFGWIYWKTRSIAACIFMHFVNNAFSYVGLSLYGFNATAKDMFGDSYLLLYVVATIVACITGYLFYLRHQTKAASVDDDIIAEQQPNNT